MTTNDTSLINLNADQKEHLTNRLDMIALGANTIRKALVTDDGASVELLKSVIANIEFAMADISKETGVQSVSADEIEERYANLRRANLRIHDLERQLGEKVSAGMGRQLLLNLDQKLNKWWDIFGFGYISDLTFDRQGCHAKLSCSLHGGGESYRSSTSSTPASDRARYQAWLDDLVQRGYILSRRDRPGDVDLIDTPQARQILSDLIKTSFPSAKLTDLETRVSSDGDFVLRSVSIYIRDFADIDQLTLESAEAA